MKVIDYLSGQKYFGGFEKVKYQMHAKIASFFNDDEYIERKVQLQHDYLSIKDLVPTIIYDEQHQFFVNENTIGFVLEGNTMTGANSDVVKTITNLLSSEIPEGTVIQISNVASPHVSNIFKHYQNSRKNAKEIYKNIASKRVKHFENANWNSLFREVPYVVRDFKIIITVQIPIKQVAQNGILQKVAEIKEKIQKTKAQEQAQINEEKQVEVLQKLKQAIISSLKSIGIFAVEVQEAGLISYLDEILNPNKQNEKREKIVYNPSSTIKNHIQSQENLLAVEENHLSFYADDESRKVCVKSFNVKTYPQYWALWNQNDLIGENYNDLAQIPTPFITTFTIKVPNNIQSMHAKVQAKALRAMQQAETQLAKWMPEIKEKAQDFDFVTKHIREGQRLVKTHFQITLFAPPSKLEEASQVLTSIYKKKGFQLVAQKYVQLQSFLGIIPFNMGEGIFDDLEKCGRTDTSLTWTCANLMPLIGEEYGYVSSPCMMLFGRRGQPLFWNPFANKGGNYNTAVVGKSGSGKSVFMQELVTSLLGFGGKVYVVDDGRSFMNACKLQGGEFMEFVNGAGVCINPFSLLPDIIFEGNKDIYNKNSLSSVLDILDNKKQQTAQAQNSDEEIDNVSEILILINTMVRQMARSQSSTDEIENSYIANAIDEAYLLKGNNASITTVRDILHKQDDKRAKDIALMLRPFTVDGEYKDYFEGKCNISIASSYMVFELSEIKNKKDLQGIVMQFIMFLVFQQMYMGDRKQSISIVIDEAWDLLHGEATGKFIEGLARRARKYNGNIITGTQSINDYYKTPATKAIIENSDWTCLLSQKAESIEAFKNAGRILMDEEMEKMLKSLKTSDKQYSEVMICGNGSYMVGRLIVDPYSIALYSSKAEDFNKIQNLTKKGKTVAQALEEIVYQNKYDNKENEAQNLILTHLQKLLNDEQNTDIKHIISPKIQGIINTLGNFNNN